MVRIGRHFRIGSNLSRCFCNSKRKETAYKWNTGAFQTSAAAGVPFANVCVAHGTLCNDPSVYIAATAKSCGCEFRPGHFSLIGVTPSSHSLNPEVPRNRRWKTLPYTMDIIEKRTKEETWENLRIKPYSKLSCKCYVLWYFR